MLFKDRFCNLKYYFFNLILVWGALWVYISAGYYMNFLMRETQITLLYLAIAYTVIGFFYNLFMPARSVSKGYLLFNLIKKIVIEMINYAKDYKNYIPVLKTTHKERTEVLFMIVKFYFLPIMLNFFFSNLTSVRSYLNNNIPIYPLLLATIFLIDTLYFSFGYSIELNTLKNKIRSVEPTILGWAVALACYPPFNSLFSKYWYAGDTVHFSNQIINITVISLMVFLLLVYLAATLALGAKCSNLTNRGIVSRGPYRYIRHPAYICKNLFWFLSIIPIMSIPALLSVGAWAFIYYLRAITEENHLIKDPDYQEYCKKVKYKFIPFVY